MVKLEHVEPDRGEPKLQRIPTVPHSFESVPNSDHEQQLVLAQHVEQSRPLT